MSILKRFNEIFGTEDSVEAERRRFIERVNQIIFHEIDTRQSDTFGYVNLFEHLCFEMGVNAHDFPERNLGSNLMDYYCPASIRTLTGEDFNKTVQLLCILYIHIQYNSSNQGKEWLSNRIKVALSLCACDIGIRWKEGFFYPSGAEELDKPLIEETVTWLKEFPEERINYQRSLECYLGNKSFGDVITNCYSAIEGIARKVLGNSKTLDNNKNELLKKIGLSDGWNSILANYIKYAHDYRHASEERHKITKKEAEGYLYMTGLIIRLIIES